MLLKRISVGSIDDIPPRCTVWQYAETLGNPFSDEKTVVHLLQSAESPRDIAVIVVETFGALSPMCRYYVE